MQINPKYFYKTTTIFSLWNKWGYLHILEFRGNLTKAGLYELMIWIVVLSLFYMISLKDYLLFYTVVQLSSVYIAYAIFFAAWESKNIDHPYIVIIGAGFFFIGSLEFLHILALNGLDISSTPQRRYR